MGPRLSRRGVVCGGGALALGIAALGPRPAQAADFYRGKTLTLIVGFAPGGGVDTQARTIARHLVRFIPGQPAVIVQNMEGAPARSPPISSISASPPTASPSPRPAAPGSWKGS